MRFLYMGGKRKKSIESHRPPIFLLSGTRSLITHILLCSSYCRSRLGPGKSLKPGLRSDLNADGGRWLMPTGQCREER